MRMMVIVCWSAVVVCGRRRGFVIMGRLDAESESSLAYTRR